MPWKEVRPMDQKVLFIADYLRGGRTFAELCRLYGISHKPGSERLPVSLPAVGNPVDLHELPVVVNLVQNPVISRPYSPSRARQNSPWRIQTCP